MIPHVCSQNGRDFERDAFTAESLRYDTTGTSHVEFLSLLLLLLLAAGALWVSYVMISFMVVPPAHSDSSHTRRSLYLSPPQLPLTVPFTLLVCLQTPCQQCVCPICRQPGAYRGGAQGQLRGEGVLGEPLPARRLLVLHLTALPLLFALSVVRFLRSSLLSSV